MKMSNLNSLWAIIHFNWIFLLTYWTDVKANFLMSKASLQ